jgi:hypothetical protein
VADSIRPSHWYTHRNVESDLIGAAMHDLRGAHQVCPTASKQGPEKQK